MLLRKLTACALFLSLFALLPSHAQGQRPEDKEYFLNVNFVPLGPVPLARFSTSKKSAGSIEEEVESSSADAAKNGKKESAGPPVQGGQTVVLEEPKDQKPPTAIYYKVGREYIRLNCNLNALGKPTRIPVKSAVLKFYTRGENNADGKPTYKLLHSHDWTENQEDVLFTLTKPLSTKKWTRPAVKTYDLSTRKLGTNQFVVLNANQEESIKLATKKGSKNLAPHGIIPLSGDKLIGLELTAIHKGKAMKPYIRYFQVKPSQLKLLLVYPVTHAEDYHRIKFVQGNMTRGVYKEPQFVRDN